MTITFEFEQDYRKYREYITYVTKVDHVIGKLPLQFYAGDMHSCFIVEKVGDIVTVFMTNNSDELKERFIELAQPDSFKGIQEEVPLMYDLDRHELIYNFDKREISSDWNWTTYPETFWMSEDDKYDQGLCIGRDSKLYRVYLSNKRLISLFVGLQELETSFPNLRTNDENAKDLQVAGVNAALSILACQLGQDEPKMNDIRTAISCDLVRTGSHESAKYDFKDLIEIFEMKGNEDDLWQEAIDNAMARDEGFHRQSTSTTTLGEITNPLPKSYANQMVLSDLSSLSEVPETLHPIYVHMDIPVHGIHYMMIEVEQTLAIFHDDLIIKEEEIFQMLENLPQDQVVCHGDYIDVEDNGGG